MRCVAIAVVLIGCGKSGESKQATKEAVTKPAAVVDAAVVAVDVRTAPAIDVDVGRLYFQYVANEIGADAKYKDRVLRVTGIIDTIGRDALGAPYIRFEIAGGNDVRAAFISSEGLDRLKKPDVVTVRCIGDNFFGKARLRGCVIDRVLEPQSGSNSTQP